MAWKCKLPSSFLHYRPQQLHLFWYADSQVKVHQAFVCSALHAKLIRTLLQPSNTWKPTKHHSADLFFRKCIIFFFILLGTAKWRMYNSQKTQSNELFSGILFLHITLSSYHLPKYKQITVIMHRLFWISQIIPSWQTEVTHLLPGAKAEYQRHKFSNVT